jgi:uncharacterized protein YceH (UPF0502 family)
LTALQKRGLVDRITGGRVERFRHKLYEQWTRNGPELAVLAELLLRGAQTRGDLRSRAGRMDAIDTLDDLEAILRPLAERRLVVFLSDPDRRGALVTHGFHTPEELSRLKSGAHPVLDAEAAPPVPDALLETKLAALVGEIESLKARTVALESEVAGLKQHLDRPTSS